MTFSMQAPSGMSDSSSSSDDEEGEVESRPPTATLSSAVVPVTSTSATTTATTSKTQPPPPPLPPRRPLRGLRQLPPALAALGDLALFRRRRIKEEATAGIAKLDAALMSVDADEADAASAAAASAARRRAQEAAESASKAEREAAAADAAVSKRLHAVSAAAGARAAAAKARAAAAKARAVAAAEAAERAEAEARRRRDEEEQAAAAARRRRQEAEEKGARERQEAAAEKEEEERRKREQLQRQAKDEEAKKTAAAAAEAKANADAAAAKAALPRPAVIASPSAALWAERAAAALAAARASAAPFLADASPAAKTRRRSVDRAITLAVQQISATTSQVDAKSRQISELLSSLSPQTGERSYGFLALSARVVAQCECQVALSPAFAFPLAQVVAAVCSSVGGRGASEGGVEELLDVVSGRLHAASPLTVPSWVRASAEGHHRKIGYRERSSGSSNELESTDDFAARLRGYSLFLGALVAAADAGRWQGQREPQAAASAAAARGWSFVAAALNALPPNRLTAVFLDGFLDAGGHALYNAYGRQFLKLLAALDEFFLPGLEAKNKEGEASASNNADADAARPAAARLRSYLHGGAFRDPPEGSVLPESDASSYDRA